MTLTRRRFLATATATAAAILGRARPAPGQTPDPAVVGQWGPRRRLPHFAIHSMPLPTTAGLYLQMQANAGTGTLAWALEPVTGQILPCSIALGGYDAMCGGAVLDQDGVPRVYGGRNNANQSARFDPATLTWTRGPYLSGKVSAYYPTAVRVGPLGPWPRGPIAIAYGKRAYVDIYDAGWHPGPDKVLPRMPATANIPAMATDAAASQYPRLLPTAAGELALLGPDENLGLLDLVTATWRPLPRMLYGRRTEGTATPWGTAGTEFLLTGSNLAALQKKTEIVHVGTGTVRPGPELQRPRWLHNSVLLPDLSIGLFGGRGDPKPTAPEILDPVREVSTLMAPTRPRDPDDPTDLGPAMRGYHSTVELLDDGRVMWAGGDGGPEGRSYEVFAPPYLFRGPRPAFTLIDRTAPLGALVLAQAPDGAERFTLLRAEHVSHGVNAGQRGVELPAIPLPEGHVQLVLPSPARKDLPPGYYRVFAFRSGVPSMAQWLKVTL